MNALFAFVILSASAVLSSPVPQTAKNPTDIDTEVDKYFDEWKKYFPEVKIPRPHFNFQVVKDPFAFDDSDAFGDSNPLTPRKPLIPSGFGDDFFKHIHEKFLPNNATKNNTIENTREVDGHVIHEKESTYSNGDENGHVVFRSKTVIIRPKDGAGNVDKKFGNGDATSKTQPKRSEYVPRFTTASASVSTFNQNNPDEDVEMVQSPRKISYSEPIREGNSIENNDNIVDLSKDTRVNDYYTGPINPKAEIFDVSAKKKKNKRKENPNAAITELSSNDLSDDKNESELVSLEHDTDVNYKTPHLKIEEDAETVDTNAIRKKRKNNYPHHT